MTADSSSLTGRRFWIAGIGGAGMSGYALVARAWGAEVAGWDRVRTSYLDHLGDIDVERVLDLLLGAFFAAVFAAGRPEPAWPEETVDAMWPALRRER